MSLIQFTRNHEDRSNERGYQFRFLCDKCGNGHESRFVTSSVGIAGTALRAAGSFFGGIFGQASNSSAEIQRMAQGKGHDDAFETAVEEAKPFFRQCSRCGQWVCPQICWNAKRGLCETCAPNLEEQIAAAQADAQVQQARQKIAQADMLGGMDVLADTSVRCPQCGAAVPGGKFCGECGTKIAAKSQCGACKAAVAPGTKFCPECGNRMGG